MAKNKNHLLETISQLTDLVQLYTLVVKVDQSTIRLCESIVAQIKPCQNEDTIKTFETFIISEKKHIQRIYRQYIHENTDTHLQINNFWLEQQFNTKRIVEIRANPYLLTPRRAFDLAIHYKKRAFDFFTVLAANLNDPGMRKQAENVALRQLKEIPELRLGRYREWKKEPKTALQRLDINKMFSRLSRINDLDLINVRIENLITDEIRIIQKRYAMTMLAHTAQVLENLTSAMPEQHINNTDHKAAEDYMDTFDASLFSALKALLGELDVAINLFLRIAETSRFENIVQSAQNKAKQYVKRITQIRRQLDEIAKN